MKKLTLIALTLLLAMGAVQAQNTKSGSRKPNVDVNGKPTTGSEQAAVPLTAIQLPQPTIGFDAPLGKCLANRKTTRDLRRDELPMEMLSSLLWSAYGFNRPDEGKRVAPSAINVQEFDIYVFTAKGVYRYEAKANRLEPVCQGDRRAEISKQPHFAAAPVSIVMVANYSRMEKFKKTEDRDFYAALDCGYISQNIYLFCASADLGTVACGGIDRDTIHKILDIKDGRAILAHPVGLK